MGGLINSGQLQGAGVRARIQLFHLDRKCYWCGRETTLELGPTHQPMRHTGTMDHEPDRSHFIVLACDECNAMRNCLANKLRANARISKALLYRLAPLMESWAKIDRPELREIRNYFDKWKVHYARPPRTLKGKRRELVEILTWQLAELARRA